jgi:hypothetical protein
MKLMKFIAMSALVCPFVCFAQDLISKSYNVPFYNANVQNGNAIVADYNFDPQHQTLVCASSSMASATVSWKYKDAKYSAILPAGGHLSLKDNQYPEGFFADPNGKIIINNSSPDKAKLIVSCEYRTWG